MSALCGCVCVCINTWNESLHSNFSILQDEMWRKWPLIRVQQMFTELIMDHTDFCLEMQQNEQSDSWYRLQKGFQDIHASGSNQPNPTVLTALQVLHLFNNKYIFL